MLGGMRAVSGLSTAPPPDCLPWLALTLPPHLHLVLQLLALALGLLAGGGGRSHLGNQLVAPAAPPVRPLLLCLPRPYGQAGEWMAG